MINFFKNIKIDIIRGIQSGYPACDIIWFLLRRHWVDITCKLNKGKYPWSKAFPRNTEEDELRYKAYRKSWLGRYKHVVCPICIVKNGIFKIFPKYHKCPRCEWVQYKKKECNRCKGKTT